MKRLTILLLLALPLIAQVSPPTGTSRTAGRFVAYNYGQWSLPIYSFPAGTGSKVFTLSSATVTMADGRQIMPFNVNAGVVVGTESVTITAVGAGCRLGDIPAGGCSLTATFIHAHTPADRVSSATFGLQEALNDAGASGGGAVTVDSAWSGLGGTSGMISGATLPTNTGIEDVRTGAGGGGGSNTGFQAVNLCAAPSTATCDGSTVDAAAVQAMLNTYPAVYIPTPPGGMTQTEINLGTVGIVLNPGNVLYGNSQLMGYTGSGIAISMDGSLAIYDSNNMVLGLTVDMTGSTGTPIAFGSNHASGGIILTCGDYGGPSGYYSVYWGIDGGGDLLSVSGHDGNGRIAVISAWSTVQNSSFQNPGAGVSTFSCEECSISGTRFQDTLNIGGTLDGHSRATVMQLAGVTTGALVFGANAKAVQGSVAVDPANITGTPVTGVISYSHNSTQQTVTYGPALVTGGTLDVSTPSIKFSGIAIGSLGALCADASGNITVSINNTGVGAPCP